ncbi:uncharacterized protein LOC113506077 [Trichoplusia ni]|uniref:Uncharacterized protein LOC113506077 n=1 Tax=Trichoplusia ni TaxID=7111 RepID=A0A7E5WW30_TRINI|nr:uncharacterized protein LOC113506077 [Trichoplusia ni]
MNQGQIPLSTAEAVAAVPLPETTIPRDVLRLIPEYSGETNLLSLFLRKCKYVIERYQGTVERNEFLMQIITSKLKGKAAALISERGDFDTYNELKSLLIQHFGDPRSEECVAIELETLKIKHNESYLEFCSRIQDIRAILMSKVNQNSSLSLREAKRVIYNNTSLNVFMYNLPEHMVRIVRIKNPDSLEEALKHVLEEVNFQEQYNLRSKMLQHRPQSSLLPSRDKGFVFNSTNPKPILTQPPLQYNNNFRPLANQPQFKFGIPNQNFVRPNMPNQQNGFRPPLNQFGYKPPVQFGYRPPVFGPKQPQQFGYRPQVGQFGYRHPQPSGYQPPKALLNDRDVTMRTAPAPAKPQQGFPVNELYSDDERQYYNPNDAYNDNTYYNMTNDYDYDYTNMYSSDGCADQYPDAEYAENVDIPQSTESNKDSNDVQNFQINSIQSYQK